MKYKIAYCLPSLQFSGGMERVLTIKANYFAEKCDCDVYIILTDGKGKQPFFTILPKIHLIYLDVNFEEARRKPFIKRVLSYIQKQSLFKRRLTKTLFEIKPDICISTLRREINFINSIKDGSVKIGELHFSKDSYRNEADIRGPKFIKKLIVPIWKKQLIRELRKLDQFVVLTEEDKKNWNELNNVTAISNPLSFFPDKTSDCTNKQVIAAGRFVYMKGFDLLIDSWKIVSTKHPDWVLRIFGEGERKSYLKQIDSLGLHSKCFLENAVPNIDEKFRESSLFVLSSRFEGFGLVITEAMSCGLPAVSFDCPCGPRTIIKDGEDGFLVENGNIEKLADKISYLIENENVRRKMGQQAHLNVKRFKVEVVANQWMDLFKSLNIQ